MIMKKIFAAGIFLVVTFTSYSQTDNSTIEQYCQVIATPGLLVTR